MDFDFVEQIRENGIYLTIIFCFIMISVSGLFFGFTYFFMDTFQTALESTDCVIENNVLVGTCQELFELSFYPFLALKSVLVWASYFFIFGLVLALLVLGYRSGSSPVLMGVLVFLVGGITYLGIVLSNMYYVLIQNSIMQDIMSEFVVYNKIMLNFPWFSFFIGLFSIVLGIVNYQRSSVNTFSGEEVY